MMRILATAAVALAFAACGGGDSDKPAAPPKPPPPPSAKCAAAATNLAGMQGKEPSELAAEIDTIKAECESLHLTDDEAQCLADAPDKLGALKCPRALTAELREVDGEIGTGPCRPVMLVTHLAEIAQLRQIPEEQRMAAMQMFQIVKKTLGTSCRRDNWGKEAMECFATRDVMRAFGCIEMVPPKILEKIDHDIKAAMAGAGGDESFAATGIEECDAYLRSRASFEACDAVPPGTRQSMLKQLAPLEKAWRHVSPEVLATSAATIAPVCVQALNQLGQIATAAGCDPGAPVTTGVEACDAYMHARHAFERCETIPESTRKSMLGLMAAYERPWRNVPAATLASASESYTALCDAASGQLGQLATSAGCVQ